MDYTIIKITQRIQHKARTPSGVACGTSSATFEASELVVRAYNTLAWRYHRPKSKLNFPGINNYEEAEFLTPKMQIVS
jgi:hypothetical protein